jgi:hypothetical protein
MTGKKLRSPKFEIYALKLVKLLLYTTVIKPSVSKKILLQKDLQLSELGLVNFIDQKKAPVTDDGDLVHIYQLLLR